MSLLADDYKSYFWKFVQYLTLTYISDLNALDARAVNIGLDLNVSKFRSKSFYILSHVESKYLLQGILLLLSYHLTIEGNTVKDLGVIYGSDFNFRTNIDMSCYKALKSL